jgi:hypothetical protein
MHLSGLVSAVTLAALPLGLPEGDRLQQYLGLAKATLEQPIRPQELEAALLSPAGVRDVAALFERSIASAAVTSAGTLIPELGGEATLHKGALRLAVYRDPRQEVVRRMLALGEDPAALLDFLTGSVEGQHVLASTGGLHAHLFQMTRRTPTADQRRVLRSILDGAAATHLKTWTVTPEVQREMIETLEWRGRYVGFWHLHPPLRTAEGLGAGMEPSMEDMRIALEKQQLLTIVFHPDGFDAYDLEPLSREGRSDLSLARVFRHRSPEWRARFRAAPP